MIKPDDQELKVFWFFLSKKNKESSFSEEKEAKRLLFLVLPDDTWAAIGAGRNACLLLLQTALEPTKSQVFLLLFLQKKKNFA